MLLGSPVVRIGDGQDGGMTSDHVIAAIDNAVRDYEAGPDAMRWSPERKGDTAAGRAPGGIRPRPQDLRRLTDAMREVVLTQREAMQRLAEAWRPLTEWARSPQGQAALAAAQEVREATRICHCLCASNHPDQFPCQGDVLAAEVVTVRFGDTDVPLCPPCAQVRQVEP